MEPKKKQITDYIIPIMLAIFALYVALIAALSYDKALLSPVITAGGRENFNMSLFLSDLTQRMETGHVGWTESSPKFLLGTVLIGLLTAGYVYTNKRKFITGKEYGTAEWGVPKQVAYLSGKGCLYATRQKIKKDKKLSKAEKAERIKDAEEQYRFSDILLTKTESLSLYHTDSLNCNTLVMAGSGAGKTTGYAMPNILQASDSKYSPCYVITDPKGEILQRTGYFLKEKAGYKVRVLNLKDQKRSLRYNPFKYINVRNDVGELENQVKKLATAIMEYSADPESKKGEAFWTEMSIACLESLFLAVHYGFVEEERNMNTVMWLFSKLSIDEDHDKEDSDLDMFFREYNEHFSGDYDALNAYRKYKEFRNKCKGRTANSVLATMKSKLGAFDNKNIQRIVSNDDMHLELLGEERTAIFIVLPPMEKVFNFIANLLYVQMFDMIEYTATVKHDQKLPIPVRFILDEFYNTGRIPSFDSILSYARSFGVSISIIIQSLDQLKSMYEKTWGTIVDNCSTFLYLGGVGHTDNLKYISEKLGKGTYDKRNYSRQKGTQSSSTTAEDKLGRELMTPDEVGKINNRKCILFIAGKNPFYSDKNYFAYHPNYKYTWDADKAKNVFMCENDEVEKKVGEDGKMDLQYKPDDIDPSYESYEGDRPVEDGNINVMKEEYKKEPDPVIELDMMKAAENFELEADKYVAAPDDEIIADGEEASEFEKYDGADAEVVDMFINAEVDEMIEDGIPSEDEIADLNEDLDISEIDKVLKNDREKIERS